MAKRDVVVERGTVASFDRESARGEVRVGNRTWTFDSTNFYSGRPVRYPTPGESVEVLLAPSGDALLGVRAAG